MPTMRSFFFQAEDGIRGRNVTGVQTCALPISAAEALGIDDNALDAAGHLQAVVLHVLAGAAEDGVQIGRASCRERMEAAAVDVSLSTTNYGTKRSRYISSPTTRSGPPSA